MKACLVVLEYTDLCGAIYDAYRVYQFIPKNWQLNIITDIKEYNNDQNVEVEEDFNTFMSKSIKYKDINSLLPYIKECNFFYYSGHGIKEGLLLPDKNVLCYTTLRSCLDHDNVFIVLDCCNASSLELSYEYTREKPRLINCNKITKNKIWLFTASREEEKAKSGKDGSFFTTLLFSLLKLTNKKIVNLLRLLNRQAIGYGKERYAAFCSLPSMHKLPSFLFDLLAVDKEKNLLIIHKSKK
jgi:hypothetical protein